MYLDLDNLAEAARDPYIRAAVGSALKAERENRRLSLEDISRETRISVSALEMTELGYYNPHAKGTYYSRQDFDPQGFYYRKFLLAYGRALNLTSVAIDYDSPSSIITDDVPVQTTKNESVTNPLSVKALQPPKFGEYLLYLLLTRLERVCLIGDLREEYVSVAEQFGRRKANLWYYKQVITSLGPLLKRSILGLRIVVAIADLTRHLWH